MFRLYNLHCRELRGQSLRMRFDDLVVESGRDHQLSRFGRSAAAHGLVDRVTDELHLTVRSSQDEDRPRMQP